MIEKLKVLEAAATPGPWTNAEVWCDQNSGSDSTTEWKAYRADADFITTLRTVAPELIRLWEAVDVLCNPPADLPATDLIQLAVVKDCLNWLNDKAATITPKG